jgi:hypothetical protein
MMITTQTSFGLPRMTGSITLTTYRSRLRLSNQIPTKHRWLDSSLLNCRWLFKTITVNTTQQFFRDFHSIERFNRFIPVRIKVGFRQPLWRRRIIASCLFAGAFRWRFITVVKTARNKSRAMLVQLLVHIPLVVISMGLL